MIHLTVTQREREREPSMCILSKLTADKNDLSTKDILLHSVKGNNFPSVCNVVIGWYIYHLIKYSIMLIITVESIDYQWRKEYLMKEPINNYKYNMSWLNYFTTTFISWQFLRQQEPISYQVF